MGVAEGVAVGNVLLPATGLPVAVLLGEILAVELSEGYGFGVVLIPADWHAALFPFGRSGMHRITVADWRKGEEPMQVVSGAFGHEKVHYEAPPSDAVPAEMERLIEWCNTADQSPFIMAAVAHLWFVTIHPFDDGNGRISRTLADMLLARLDEDSARYYSMSAEIDRNKKAYYEVLERTQKGDLDITEWMLWFFGCLENAIVPRGCSDHCSWLRD